MHYNDQENPSNLEVSVDPACSVSFQLCRSPLMKPEMMMKLRTKMLMPVNTLLTRVNSRTPRTCSPVGKMAYETSKIAKSIETESRLVVAQGWRLVVVDRW